jgi:nucleoside-diphosphate-sugar epimerase
MARALVLGGSGAVGQAAALRLRAGGWDVDVTGRRPDGLPTSLIEAGARYLVSDRDQQHELRSAVGPGTDLLLDCLCFSADHARQLLPVLGDAGTTVMMSSKAVYIDAARNHVNSDDPPRFDTAIREDQPTLPPGSMDYNSREGYGRNKVAAERVLLDSGHPVTVLRASKVHGPGASNPREWFFVRRVLDRRPAVLLARRGAGIDHTSAAANIAALVETVATLPGQRILNAADPDAPSAIEIARTIARHLGHDWRNVLLEPGDEPLGDHPWNAPSPIVLDMRAAVSLGYSPVGTYAETVDPAIDWLVEAVRTGGDQRRAAFDEWFSPSMFDYGAEDDYLKEPLRTYGNPGSTGSVRACRCQCRRIGHGPA